MNLTDGIFRCRFHQSWSEPEFLESGRIYEIAIEPFATANLFKRRAPGSTGYIEQ